MTSGRKSCQYAQCIRLHQLPHQCCNSTIHLHISHSDKTELQRFTNVSLKSNFTCSAHRNKLVKQTRTLVTDNKWLSDSQFWSKISCNDRKQMAHSVTWLTVSHGSQCHMAHSVTWLTVSHGSQWRLRLERHSEASYIKKWI